MKRNIYIKRLYSLGDYRNIEISNTIDLDDSVPDSKIPHYHMMLLVDIEEAYRKYLEIIRVAGNKISFEEAIGVLEDIRSNVLLKLGEDDPKDDPDTEEPEAQ